MVNSNLIYESENDLFTEVFEYLNEKKAEGKKIIAYLNHEFIPPELIEAAGAVPLPLIFAGNDDYMTIGGDYLNPTVCSYARSLIGIFKEKDQARKFKFLDLIDGIIVSDYCTANLLVTESITKNFNITPIEFFIPHFNGVPQINYFEEQLKSLASDICKITKCEINNTDFIKFIKKYNKFRDWLSHLYEFDLSGSEQLKIVQKALLFGPDYIQMNLIDSLKKRDISSLPKKVIFSGCANFIGDNIIDMIEEMGGNVVYNNTWIGNIVEFGQIPINGDSESPYKMISKLLISNNYTPRNVLDFNEKHAAKLAEIAEKTGTRAIVNHIIKFCDEIGYDREDIRKKLMSKQLQVLNLEKDYSREMKGQIKTRIEAFLEIID